MPSSDPASFGLGAWAATGVATCFDCGLRSRQFLMLLTPLEFATVTYPRGAVFCFDCWRAATEALISG